MSVRPIVKFGDPLLRTGSKKVTSFGSQFNRLIKDMLETMFYGEGVGLSAIQVGVAHRIILADADEKALLYVNPVILYESSDQSVMVEGCMSIPGLELPVWRPSSIIFKALSWDNRPVRVPATGRLARIVQHEIDHLNGVLFVDRVWEKELSDEEILDILEKNK